MVFIKNSQQQTCNFTNFNKFKLEFKKTSIYETTFKTFCPNLW